MNQQTFLSLEQIPFATVLVDQKGNIQKVNHAVEQLSGFNVVALENKPLSKLFEEPIEKQNLPKLQQTSCFVSLKTKQDKTLPVQLKLSQFDGGFYLFITEVNEHSNPIESQTKRLLDELEEPFWIWDLTTDKVHYSSQFMALLGYEAASFDGTTDFWTKHTSSSTLTDIQQQIKLHIDGQVSKVRVCCEVTTQAGQLKWIDMIAKVLDYHQQKPTKMFGLVRDITELKSVIHTLKKQNDYLNLAEQLGQSGHWNVDLKTNSLYWSSGVYKIHGVDPSEFTPTVEDAINFYEPAERPKIQALLQKAIEDKQGYHFNSVIRTKLGNRRKVESIGQISVNAAGEVTNVFGVFRDITVEANRYEKLKLLALVTKTINMPVFFIDEQDNVVHQEISVKSKDKGAVLFNYINFSITEYLDFKKQAKINGQLVKKNISFDNYLSVFNFSVNYLQNEGIYIWIIEDVTDNFKKEQQQAISNRLALLGNTFGNVSHDINNVLGVALGSVELLELKLMQGDSDVSKYVNRVKNAIDKGKTVTERLLAFTRKPKTEVAVFDPIQDIKDNQYLFEQLLLGTIELEVQYPDGSCTIKFPKGEFINILLNIVLNAQDAIQEQGVTGKILITANIINKKLIIDIKDSGSGIKSENLPKVFDPFYSTKSVNKGNGIGLANVYDTMYKHNGEVQVKGKCDLGGAHFTLIFSCVEAKVNTKAKTSSKSDSCIAGKSFLVLDDEQSIGEFVALYLEHEGAKVKYVQTKPELQRVLQQNDHFDVFIGDMIMPDMSGREAVAMVLDKLPNIKILTMSGYIAVEESSWEYSVLRKPFNSSELKQFLCEEL